VADARSAGRLTSFEDRRMWRLLLAQVHPDAGGNHDLFLFAYALKQGACNARELETKHAPDDQRQTRRGARPFLRAWHDSMEGWASCNRVMLKGLRAQRRPFTPVRY